MHRVELRNIVKRFGNFTALKNIDIVVEEGELLSLLGPSGCGKTTTLRIIAGLEAPTEGDVFIEGKRVNNLSASERNIAMVFQFVALYPYISVWENLAFPLKAQKMPAAKIHQKVKEISTILGLNHILNRYPRDIHPAEGQMVSIGKAVIRDPEVYLFDEPLSHLDANMRVKMRADIKHLHESLGRSMVFVTHDQLEAMGLSDRIAIMSQGEIVQIGPPQEIFHKPVNLYVADFVGSPPMNFLECRTAQDGDACYLQSDSVRIRIKKERWIRAEERAGSQQFAQKTIVMGIRPRHIKIHQTSETGKSGFLIPGVVEFIDPEGKEVALHIRLSESISLKAMLPFHFQVKEKVWIELEQDQIKLFLKDSGEAILV
ncbi:MAG TPA: ABC transporter ATP-binding protein [Atribacteraceae bacterium]|nr:ABC transporter ATP-binding protein [Atribacteraceae bacterium]